MMSDADSKSEPQEDWRKLHALGLPAGSVRAMLAVLILGGIWCWLWLWPEREVPAYLEDLMFIILGYYFASRKTDAAAEPGPPPLFLPRGTIRILLILGFGVVTAGLIRRHAIWSTSATGDFRLNPAAVALILVAGFLIGVVASALSQWWTGRGHRLPRLIEDVRAILSLAAAVTLLLTVFGLWSQPHQGPWLQLEHFCNKYHALDLLAAVVGFYFGSRS